MSCAVALAMPVSYSVMNSEDMTYVEGGSVTIGYSPVFLSKIGVMAYAASYKSSHGWKNISTYDLGAEIFFHAVLHYKGAQTVASILSLAGGKIGSKAASIVNSLKDGIDVDNGRDTKKEFGIERWKIYDAFYVVGPAAF